ncbi:MAG: hypothetical protein ACREMA_01360 [Longimicrobiales bacterium]
MRTFVISAALTLACASGAAAQIVWDSPFLVPPRPSPGFGIYLADVGDVGGLVTWQPSPTSWGFRVGIANTPRDNIGIFGGADVSGALTRSSANMPLDIDWLFGVGAGVADDVIVSVPVGLTLGHTFQGDGAQFTPYVSPRLIVDGIFGEEDDELELAFAIDLGLDLRLQPGLTIRVGGTLGDREAIAIGLVF